MSDADLASLAAKSAKSPRILLFDLERLPGEYTADIWQPADLRRVNYLHPDRWSRKPTTLMASWMWYGERSAHVVAAWEAPDDPWHVARVMREQIHNADCLVTFNGRRADLKWLRQDWAQGQIVPPRPCKDIDLFVAARTAFALESRSLAYLCQFLGLPGKAGKYDAAEAKAAALADGPERRRLVRYSKQDSVAMGPVLDRMRPFLRHGPNLGIPFLDDAQRCPVCGSDAVTRDGWVDTDLTRFAAFVCECGAWSRSKHRRHSVVTRRVSA